MPKTNSQQMFDNILQWQQSGLSKKAWCEQHHFSYSFFHYWCKRFQKRQGVSTQSAGNDFVQLLVRDSSLNAPWCELHFGNGHKLLFHQPVSLELIRGLLG